MTKIPAVKITAIHTGRNHSPSEFVNSIQLIFVRLVVKSPAENIKERRAPGVPNYYLNLQIKLFSRSRTFRRLERQPRIPPRGCRVPLFSDTRTC